MRLIELRFVFICLILLQFGVALAQTASFSVKEDAGISEVFDIANFYGHGASAADFDNDGDIDFYLSTTSGVKDRLYENLGNGVFQDIALEVGINMPTGSRMSVWFDYNNDKRLDIVILGERCATFSCGSPILINLYEQQEDGTFINITEKAGFALGNKYDGLDPYAAGGMAVADLTGDGYLDLLVAVWGGKLSLFENNGDGSFTDISELSNVGEAAAFYWQPMLYDFDGDGRPDIYCNVDFGRNQLWVNDGDNTFTEIAARVGLASDHSEMGMAINDFDNDGDFDVYATNITRVFQGENEHNVLLRNDSESGFLLFNEVATSYNVAESGWDWGTTFFDADNNGWVDLAATNGWNNDPLWGSDQSQFWINFSGNFTDNSILVGFDDRLSATTLIAFDADRDGDLDLLQTLKDNPDTKMPAVLYENQSENAGNYLVVRPRMKDQNHWAIGAVVKARGQSFFNMRLISAGTSFYGQEPAEAFFGLNKNEKVEIEIDWPDGTVSIYENVSANQVITLENEVIAAPAEVSATLNSDRVVIAWTDQSDNEAGFRIQKSISRDFSEVVEIEVDANITAFEETYQEEYPYYRVRAYSELVSSPYSQVVGVAVTTQTDQPEEPKIFPNPSDGQIYISLPDEFPAPVMMQLLDAYGRCVWSSGLSGKESLIDLKSEAAVSGGVYFLQLIGQGRNTTSRLIIRD